MTWEVTFLDEAIKDLKELDGSVRPRVLKGIKKVSQNPLPMNQGGYGKPLGNKNGVDLTNLLKIKFLDLGIRVVYKLLQDKGEMKVIIISVRTDEQVYKEAIFRRKKHEL